VYKAVTALLPGLSSGRLLLFSLTGVLLVLAGLLLAANALRKVDAVRAGVASLRSGDGKRLQGGDLVELAPLVQEMNALLEHRERVARRAMATAGDLAHGLKTPLAIVAQEAERLDAPAIAEQVERMRRQIDYHLARARTSASAAPYAAPVELRPIVERLVRTVGRLYADKDLRVSIDVPDSCTVRCETEDLEEMLGNVLDNACKFARSAITVSASCTPAEVAVAVDDDGPGIDPALRDRVLQRGVRADEAAPGSGLGLAIVSDLAELYGGSVALESGAGGGVRVRIVLPRQQSEQ
jgi:signal transduction histidine kinase